MAAALILLVAGLLKSDRSKSIALAGCFICYCALTSSLSPLEGALGRYSGASIQSVAGKDVWIPCDYRAKDEEYRLLLPGARLHGYPAQIAGNIAELSSTYSIVAVQTPIGEQPRLCENCAVLGQRMEMRARQSEADIKAILMGQIGKYLFVNEYLIATPASASPLSAKKDACR